MKYFAVFAAFLLMAGGALAYTYPKELDKPWDHSPITYNVSGYFPPECDPTYADDLSKAIAYWENGGNGKLSFAPKFQKVEGASDIPIKFVDTLENISEEVGGITNIFIIPGKRFVTAPIRLACTGTFDRRGERVLKEFSHREMEITAMHELGHALGLDHTDDQFDIMTPKQIVQLFPTGFEISSYGIDLNLTSRRIIAGDSVKFSGKTQPNAKLDFVFVSKNSTAEFSSRRVVADANGFFENSAKFPDAGRYLTEIINPVEPNVFATSIILAESGADVQINSNDSAKVYLNGSLAGTAPLKLTDLKYGDYEIVCKANGLKDYKTYFSIDVGKEDDLKARSSRDAVLCANEKTSLPESKKAAGFFDKLSLAVKEFFRILFE